MASLTCPTVGSQLFWFIRQAYRDARGECPNSSEAMLSIRIDDRKPSDMSPHFCSVSVLIQEAVAPRFTLYLKNLPLDDDVTELISGKYGTITGSRPDLHVEIPLRITDVTFLRKLAGAIRRIVGRERSYPKPNWKWVCPRTAVSLNLLADRVMEFRKRRSRAPWETFAPSGQARAPDPAPLGSTGSHSGVEASAKRNGPDDEDLFYILETE